MKTDEYRQFDGLGLAQLILTGEVTAREVLDAAIGAIEAANPSINAVVLPMFDYARAAVERGSLTGQFQGVPFLVKALGAQVEGFPTTSGSRFFADAHAARDSTLVTRYREAGLVICGMTNTPEFGLATTTEPVLYGPTRNPRNPAHSPGGSSGGAAAAVAAGFVPIAHATDGGGSIRVPASCCGLFGLKPTRGRVPLGPAQTEGWGGLSTAHVVARTVRDSAAMLDVSAGDEPGAPYAAPPRARSYLLETRATTGTLRIALCTTPFNGVAVDPAVQAVAEAAAGQLAALGHHVDIAAPVIDAQAVENAHGVIAISHMAATIRARARERGREPTAADVETLTLRNYRYADQLGAIDYAWAIGQIRKLGVDLAGFFANHDILLTPTMACLPPKLGELDTMSDDAEAYLALLRRMIGFTAICNDAGNPAMSLPMGAVNSLPVGVQCIAGFGNETMLFRLAAQVENAGFFARDY